MNNNKQTIHFDIELFQGYTCIGCEVINDLAIEVEFTDEEVAQMKQLVCQIEDEDYCHGIMPVLKEGAPELYDRMERAVHSRYSVGDQVCMDETPDYIVDIPVDFLPE